MAPRSPANMYQSRVPSVVPSTRARSPLQPQKKYTTHLSNPSDSVLFRAAPALKDLPPAQTAFPTWAQMARFASAFEPPKPGAVAPLAPGNSGRGSAAPGGVGGWSAPVGRARGRHHATPGASAPVLPDEVSRVLVFSLLLIFYV